MGTLSTCALLGFFLFHLAAIACAWGTRMSIGSRAEGPLQTAFLIALTAVGLAAWLGHRQELGLAIPSVATLVVMVLTAVSDFRRTHEPAHHTAAASHR